MSKILKGGLPSENIGEEVHEGQDTSSSTEEDMSSYTLGSDVETFSHWAVDKVHAVVSHSVKLVRNPIFTLMVILDDELNIVVLQVFCLFHTGVPRIVGGAFCDGSCQVSIVLLEVLVHAVGNGVVSVHKVL